jgi:hypothetical protein
MGMDIYEASVHSFIVKIWLEETIEEAGQAIWRGHITHVPSGERRYLHKLDDVTAFIAPYLEDMGAKLGLTRRARRLIGRIGRRWAGQRKSSLISRERPGISRQPGTSTVSDHWRGGESFPGFPEAGGKPANPQDDRDT